MVDFLPKRTKSFLENLLLLKTYHLRKRTITEHTLISIEKKLHGKNILDFKYSTDNTWKRYF